ncbi:PREDICTED: MORN repeat-containing protein 3-like [Priapulus caudatus]|uniref:MORN repeat-containing protein 3 n=1 Tax=Priapulus caudatus TaxID=37621 RepID=A0ABM1F9H6_PRICU|nr:PREDICTED: MORN repeat-containing protein 3-like [Priapulus caudatus]XP_014681098.1 PREDICTED: MORN repeat-containing protein 3-like [Priapulus caudatus]XP_014681099.1 PREDICTED: MORN repeat-containing protein 3-like [Priapulus caudatus]
MPHLKPQHKTQPLWKTWDNLAQKKGIRHTVYAVNGDEYTGEWLNNHKHGKGTEKTQSTGAIYDGDWKWGKRDGFGTYSVPDGEGIYIKQYSGGWRNGLKHGYGMFFYGKKVFYEGEWKEGKRSGWGRMVYDDGSIYEGEWQNDLRHGDGMLRLPNENRYEGSWKADRKNGPGKFYYLDRGQQYNGVWVDDVPRCGALTDYGRSSAPMPTKYVIPECALENVGEVLLEASDDLQQLEKRTKTDAKRLAPTSA